MLKAYSLFLIIVLALAGCGGQQDEFNSKVDLEVVPDNPLVVNADITLPDSDGDSIAEEVVAPWFRASFTIENGTSDRYLVVVAVIFKIYNEGGTVAKTVAFDAGELDETFLYALAPGTDSSSVAYTFYVDSLPDDTSGTFTYQVELEPLGYFADVSDCTSCSTPEDFQTYAFNNPSERLTTTLFFITE